jgi:uncharacterized protein (DUF427 family)
MTEVEQKEEPRIITPGQPWQRSGRTFLLEPRFRRLRVQFGGAILADTEKPWFFTEWRDPLELVQDRQENKWWMSMPFWYYVPQSDVNMEYLIPSGPGIKDKRIGQQMNYSFQVGDCMARDAAWMWTDLTGRGEELDGLVGFNHHVHGITMYEEEDEIPFGPRNMYHAVEARHSSRHIVVSADDVVLADSTRTVFLYETGIPVRFYFPKQDVRMDLLEPIETRSSCPWKGEARYWNLRGNEKFDESIWSYEAPLLGAETIAHRIGFWHERGFEISVDGATVEIPRNPFPKRPLTFSWTR